METARNFNPLDFPDLLQDISLSSVNIFDMIKDYKLNFVQLRDSRVEWKIAFPMFVDAFYKYVIKYKKIPVQREFFNYYQFCNKKYFRAKNYNDRIMEALKARAYRTYPSLVRDLYFNKLVKEKLDNIFAIYNTKLDIEEGIDLMIICDGIYYAINLFTNTSRAHFGRTKKRDRHTKFSNVKYIELPVDFKGSLKCGNFYLYGDNEFQILKNNLKI